MPRDDTQFPGRSAVSVPSLAAEELTSSVKCEPRKARGLVGIGSRCRTTVLVGSREPLVIRLQSAILRADWACPGQAYFGDRVPSGGYCGTTGAGSVSGDYVVSDRHLGGRNRHIPGARGVAERALES